MAEAECACERGYCAEGDCLTAAPFAACEATRMNDATGEVEQGACVDPSTGTGAFTVHNATGVACSACPRGGVCLGGLALPYPAAGYSGVAYPLDAAGQRYVPGDWGRVTFRECADDGRCKRDFECARAFQGLLCDDEADGYFSFGGYVMRCGFSTSKVARARQVATTSVAIAGVVALLQHALTLYAREARAVENVAQERMDAARDAAAGAKRENRLESRRDLEGKVADVRATIRGVADEKRRTGRKFALTPGIFSSLIAPDEESRRRRREANLLSEWRAAVQDERHRVETLRSTNLDHYADERLSPYVHYRGPKNREELGTASSLVDGSGVFKEAPPPPGAADPFRGIFKPLDDPAYESNLMDLSRNPFLRQPSNLEHLSDLRGMEHLGSWEVSDGIHNDDSVLVPGTSLPPSMMSADRIYRPKPRKEPIRL